MTIEPAAAYLAIVMMAAVTLGTRLGGAYLMRFVRLSPRITQFLEAMSASVLAAIVVTYLVNNGTRELAAVGAALLVAWFSKSAVWAMLAGLLVAAAWTGLLV